MDCWAIPQNMRGPTFQFASSGPGVFRYRSGA